MIIGQSGGEANLFGNIPGKGYGIDVTVSLKTTINTIIRVTDQDLWELPLKEGDEYPAGLFICRQVWTGAVDNYIPGIRLSGQPADLAGDHEGRQAADRQGDGHDAAAAAASR